MRGVKGLNDASNGFAYPSVFVGRARIELHEKKREGERERSIDLSRVDPACPGSTLEFPLEIRAYVRPTLNFSRGNSTSA